jgi:hypothetical protein
LENAIETLESTNKRINSLIEQHIADVNLSTNNLGMLLNGVVDASVNGGISNYKVSTVDSALCVSFNGRLKAEMLLVVYCDRICVQWSLVNLDAINPDASLSGRYFWEQTMKIYQM